MGTELARRFAAGCMAHGSACDPWRFISKGRCGIKHVTRTIWLACARQSKMPHASCAYWWQGPATSQKKSSQNGQQHDPILRYIFWPVFWAPLHNLVGGGSPETKSVPKTGVAFRTQFFGLSVVFCTTWRRNVHHSMRLGLQRPARIFKRWVQSHAIKISSRRVHTKAEEGRAQRSSGSARPPMHE